jgi:hypothetical protein
VLPIRECNGRYQLVARVDFDMAFTKEQAVSVWTDPPQSDPEIATFEFAAELGSFVRDLAGITAVVSGVSTAIAARKQPRNVNCNPCCALEGTSQCTRIAGVFGSEC